MKEIADKLMSADTGEIRVWCTKVVEPAKRTEANDREARMVLYNLAMRAGEDERLAGHLRKALTDTLSDKPSAPVADFMLNMLRYVADDSVVPVVAEHLSEPLLCDRACKVLVSVGSTRARDALQAALPTAKGPAQLAVVHALGELPATGAVPALLELAVSEDVEMCTAAGNALAATGDPRAQSVLLKATESPSAYRRACAAEAYLLYLRNLKDKTRATTLAIAFAKQRAGENHIQAAVLEVCSRCSAAPAVEFVLGALTHPDRRVRLAAGCALAELPQEAVGAPLGALLKTAPKATRADLLELVGERKLKGASPVVREFIAGQDVESRTAAVVALSRILGLVAVPELVKLLGDGREGVSEAAGAALLGMEDERMTAALTKAARTGTADVRAKLIGVMATRLEPGQVAAVLEFVADKDKVVAKAAATALGKLAGTADIPPFARMLGTCRDDGLRSALETSLCAVVRRVADAKVTAPPVLDALKTAEPAARPSLLKVLSVIGGKEALAAVVARLAGEDATVTLATVRAVSEWPDYSAQPALLELVKTTENTVHYVLAYRGYVRLLNARNLPGSEKLAAYCAIEELARRADEKKLVLAGMGAMKDRLALPKLLAILKDDALRNEAASAIIELARAVRGDDAVSALRKVLSAKLDSALAKRAKEAFVDITKYAGCIATWELSGPYMDRGKTHTKIYPVVFSPEKPSAKGVVWRRVMAENKDGRLNLSKVVGGNSRCVYLRCNIVVAKETAARLEVGSDDGVHVWLNGNTVHENNVPRAFIWCEDSVDVVLLEGVNTLMLKITQGGGGWEANARVQDPAGGPIEGLNFETGAPVRRALKLPQGKLADGTPTAEKLGWRMSIQCYSF
ncbi:MAG: HEAT repeat domain-containing protein, partial [Lentisphaeria bacterium]|nr:HEAT repeat domain-containing protein [Lentisphaeria bacterium]